MIDKSIIVEMDQIIKDIWTNEIIEDYNNDCLLKEDSLKCSLYFHLRKKLEKILEENNLRIYPEYYFTDMHYYADIAIVMIDPNLDTSYLVDKVIDVIAIFELKYDGGNSIGVDSVIRKDIQKVKNYIQSGKYLCQYYFVVIYETDCDYLNWLDKRSANKWAKGYVTELNAGRLNGRLFFEVNSYNEMN